MSQKVGITSDNTDEPLHQVRNHEHPHRDADGISANSISNPVRSEINASEHCGKGNKKRQRVRRERVHDPADYSRLRATSISSRPAHCRRKGTLDLKHPFAEEQRAWRWHLPQDAHDRRDISEAL